MIEAKITKIIRITAVIGMLLMIVLFFWMPSDEPELYIAVYGGTSVLSMFYILLPNKWKAHKVLKTIDIKLNRIQKEEYILCNFDAWIDIEKLRDYLDIRKYIDD